MQKLKLASCVVLLIAAVGLSVGSHGSSGIISVKGLIAADSDCVKCTDVGCVGGSLLCAQFECKGVLVQCFTGGPPPPPEPPEPPPVAE